MNNSSILIVDDNINDLDVLKDILQPHYTIYFAKSGKDAINRAKQNKPDLILLDIVMPDINGYEVLLELKKSDITQNIPVIFITGLDQVEDEEKAFHFGAVDYITKPFHASIIKARIKSHLKISEKIKSRDNAAIVIKTRQELRNILLRELMYISISGHWLNFHLISGEVITIYASLKQYEEILLADSRFVHCHKSFIINMDYVEVLEIRNVLMKNNILLPISKKYMNIKKHYSEWVNKTTI